MNVSFKYVTTNKYINATNSSIPIKSIVVQLVNTYFHFYNCLKRV